MPNYEGIGSCIARHQIDVMFITTALFNAVIDEAPQALSGVRQLLVGGEALSVEHIRRAQKTLTGVELTNIYGPTESTTFACHHRIEELKGDERGIAIGRAIGNTQVTSSIVRWKWWVWGSKESYTSVARNSARVSEEKRADSGAVRAESV